MWFPYSKRRAEAAEAASDARKTSRGARTSPARRAARPGLEGLPEEVVGRILNFADAATLCALEAASPLVRRASIRTLAWRAVVAAQLPEFSQCASLVNVDGVGRDPEDRTHGPVPVFDAFEDGSRNRRLNASLKRFALAIDAVMRQPSQQLLRTVQSFSTYDNVEEDPLNTLLPSEGLPPARVQYWSSSGSPDRDSDEFIEYRLRARICMVEEVTVTPYLAFFQEGHPIYAPRAVRVLTTPPELRRERPRWGQRGQPPEVFSERRGHVLEMENVARPQTLRFDPPLLCVGNLVVLLEGRQQVQDCDGLYYTCLAHVSAKGWMLRDEPGSFRFFVKDGVLEGQAPGVAVAAVQASRGGLSEDVPEARTAPRRRIPIDLIIPDELRFLLQQHWDAEALETEQSRMPAPDPSEGSQDA